MSFPAIPIWRFWSMNLIDPANKRIIARPEENVSDKKYPVTKTGEKRNKTDIDQGLHAL